jgi:hypothetical protein
LHGRSWRDSFATDSATVAAKHIHQTATIGKFNHDTQRFGTDTDE